VGGEAFARGMVAGLVVAVSVRRWDDDADDDVRRWEKK